MFTNARKFYIENVRPSYNDFIEHRASNDWGENQLLRKGIIAATSLFHLREHIPPAIRPSKSILRNQYPDYGLIGDIANVSKHHEISRDNPQITNASQIYENLRLIVYKDEIGEYTAPQLEVYVKLDNGTELKLINILYNTMSMWRIVLDSLDIISDAPLTPLLFNNLISRDEASKRETNMQIRKGENYNLGFRMEKYNYENNVIEPMDTTGASIKFQILRIPENAPIHIRVQNDKLGVNLGLDFEIPLSEDQARKYASISEYSQKERFLRDIVDKTPEIKKDIESKINALLKAQLSNRS